MDCEGGLTKLDTPLHSPRHTMGTDMNLVMAYWELEKKSQYTITRKWVMGHAADKKKEKPDTMTPMEHANIGYDLEFDLSIFCLIVEFDAPEGRYQILS